MAPHGDPARHRSAGRRSCPAGRPAKPCRPPARSPLPRARPVGLQFDLMIAGSKIGDRQRRNAANHAVHRGPWRPAGSDWMASWPVAGVSANSRYCDTSAPALTLSGMTLGTPRPRSSRMCAPGRERHARRCASALDTIDEHRTPVGVRLHHQGAHAPARPQASDRTSPRPIRRRRGQERQRPGPPLAVRARFERLAPERGRASVNGASGLKN